MPNNSVTFHRFIKASLERIFKAFSDANAQLAWLPPYGFLYVVEQFEFKMGGAYRMRFINFSTGNGHSFGREFVEIKTNEFIKTQTGLMTRICQVK